MALDNKVTGLAMGQYDDPLNQQQPIFYLNHYLNNIVVFGESMSGKTTFIKTLLVRLNNCNDTAPGENTYIIDFGGNVGKYGELNNVCACFDNSNEENIKRIFKTIEKRLDENSKLLGSQNYYSCLKNTPDNCPTHLTLILENLNAFFSDERYSNYHERLMKLCRDGITKGLTVVVTANDTVGIGRLLVNFAQRVAFEMQMDNYFEIFNTKVQKPIKVPGRCIINKDSSTYECQIFLPFDEFNDNDRIEELIQKNSEFENSNKLVAFSGNLTQDNIYEYCSKEKIYEELNENKCIVGLDYYDHLPVSIDFKKSRAIAVYGKSKVERTNLLELLLDSIYKANKQEIRFVFLEDGRNETDKIFSKYESNSVLFKDVYSLMFYLAEGGYTTQSFNILDGSNRKAISTGVKQTPFTVFILQSKTLYQEYNKKIIDCFSEEMIGRAEESNYLFVFSDVRRITDSSQAVKFNNMITTAFLLDNIGEFVADKGSRSVFGEMDAKELRLEYAKCAENDGYYYNTEKEELKKLRFIKIQ